MRSLATIIAFVGAAAVMGPHPAGTGAGPATAGGPGGVLPAAGRMFFAFAGYARIATLGEEVKDPARTIPRAILGALAGAFAIYLAMAVLLLNHLPDGQLAASTAPLLDAVANSRLGAGAPLLPRRLGADQLTLQGVEHDDRFVFLTYRVGHE